MEEKCQKNRKAQARFSSNGINIFREKSRTECGRRRLGNPKN
jgi:hypothetical protein